LKPDGLLDVAAHRAKGLIALELGVPEQGRDEFTLALSYQTRHDDVSPLTVEGDETRTCVN